MFNFFKKDKLPQAWRKQIAPSDAFKEKTRDTFLVLFDAAHPGSAPAHAPSFAKALIAAGALFSVLASVSVYADTADVAADNPLYPLKRLGETVQLTLTPVKEKPQLQATFAARRVTEISDLTVREPSSKLIGTLSEDFDAALDTSLNEAENAKLANGDLTRYCDKVLSAIATSSPEARFNVIPNAKSRQRGKVINRFVDQCDPMPAPIAAADVSVTAAASVASVASTDAAGAESETNPEVGVTMMMSLPVAKMQPPTVTSSNKAGVTTSATKKATSTTEIKAAKTAEDSNQDESKIQRQALFQWLRMEVSRVATTTDTQPTSTKQLKILKGKKSDTNATIIDPWRNRLPRSK